VVALVGYQFPHHLRPVQFVAILCHLTKVIVCRLQRSEQRRRVPRVSRVANPLRKPPRADEKTPDESDAIDEPDENEGPEDTGEPDPSTD
jgi:hypothetical protein